MSATDPALALNGETPAKKAGFIEYLKQHPKGFWFIFWGEFAERCSFYGMRAILATYIAIQMGFGKDVGGMFYYFFIASCYLLPLAGGWIADNYFGKFNTIVWFSIPYILGHVILGFENSVCMFIALGLLAMGTGVTKPNISTLMGMTYDQQRPGKELLRSQAFSMFYMSINIGAALSQFCIPPIKNAHGYGVAFLFPAGLMVLAFILFASGKRYYAKEVIVRKKFTSEDYADMRRVLRKIGPVFLTVTFFWAIFDQSSGTWIYFGNVFQENFSIPLLGDMDPERIQFFNPVFIVLFLPFVTYLFSVLDKKGIKVSATNKLMAGFFLTGVCMLIMAIPASMAGPLETMYVSGDLGKAESQAVAKVNQALPEWYDAANAVLAGANPMPMPAAVVTEAVHPQMGKKLYVREENRQSLWWQGLAYLILTIAEILISVTGLEMAFVVAPARMKGFVTSLWLLTVFLGNAALNAPLAWFYPRMSPASYFLMLAGMMALVMLAFFFIARDYTRLVAQEEADKTLEHPKTGVEEGAGGVGVNTTSPAG